MNKLLTVLLSIFASTAHAGEIVTSLPTSYELRDAASHPVNTVKYATLKECTDAAPVPSVKYRCVETTVFDKIGFCDDVPPPPPVVDAQGFTVVGDYAPHECPDNHYSFTQVQPVRDPYPSCAWAEKPVPVIDCNGLKIHPLLEDANSSTAQTDQTPGPWIEDVDYPLDAACPEDAHGNCSPSPRVPT